MNEDRINKQIDFFLEADKLKNVYRKTCLINNSRYETTAEHSWHIALIAIIFENVVPKVDLLRVLKMLLIHDLVEIYSGDTFAFGECNKVQIKESEKKSANKIFGLLPYDQHLEMISLWREFEEQKSSDSIFANTIDRFQPFIIECSLREKEKTIRNINKNQMCERMSIAREGMPELWEVIEKMILENF